MLKKLTTISAFAGKTFTIWVVLLALFAYKVPAAFTSFAPFIPLLLGVVMFGMGLTLRPSDFIEVLRRPVPVLLGIVCQFTFMPGLAWLLCWVFQLPSEVAVGVILVGCCPGGTASNVITYLAKGDVAFSVVMTACTTLLAPLVTPMLMYLLASQWIEFSMLGMLLSIVKIVVL
ncbi:MAG: bile acid:sodium symporter family protein, partial [Desulfovibrio sp.]|nr:bile acid:sodium symporter family protein [Desulfovibrio sp.]